jgi:hypothetical protein
MAIPERCTAFEDSRQLAAGTLEEVAAAVQAARRRRNHGSLLIFDDSTAEEMHPGAPPEPARGPGRPRLGVVAREVTLLPRHWDWLNEQPGGASVALRKLVDQARRASAGPDRRRRAREAVHRFISTLAGDEAGFEEAIRALFAGDRKRFEVNMKSWPADVRSYALRLAREAFDA